MKRRRVRLTQIAVGPTQLFGLDSHGRVWVLDSGRNTEWQLVRSPEEGPE